MRHERLTQLVELAVELQGARRGLTLDDIQDRLGVSRRTAERQLEALGLAFGWVEPVAGAEGERRKRWRMRSPSLRHLVRIAPAELAELNTAAAALERAGLAERASAVGALAKKLTAMQAAQEGRAGAEAEADLEALLRAEGLAMRPGPREHLAEGLLALLRRCIRLERVVAFDYVAQSSGVRRRRRVHPYGILYGNRAFLAARVAGAAGMALWRLGNIENPTATEETFERDAGFDLQQYARQSFGTFQERPANVALRFSAAAARDARRFTFHPEQTTQEHEDGSLTVRFKAGGIEEMCWHLVTWGEAVTVEKPLRLRRRLAQMCAALATHHGA